MGKRKHYRAVKFMLVLVLAAITITACSTDSPTRPAAAPTAEGSTPAGTDLAAAGTQNVGSYQLGFEPGSTSLKASDPSQVNLAAGKPQLIEFFAFW